MDDKSIFMYMGTCVVWLVQISWCLNLASNYNRKPSISFFPWATFGMLTYLLGLMSAMFSPTNFTMYSAITRSEPSRIMTCPETLAKRYLSMDMTLVNTIWWAHSTKSTYMPHPSRIMTCPETPTNQYLCPRTRHLWNYFIGSLN